MLNARVCKVSTILKQALGVNFPMLNTLLREKAMLIIFILNRLINILK